jgi:hypothetical protein
MFKRYLANILLLLCVLSVISAPLDVVACSGGCGIPCDPCLLVYPTLPTTYHYDPSEYYTVGPGHALYDPAYARNGNVLILDLQHRPDRIAYEVYQAPNLQGFQESYGWGYKGYYFTGITFDLVIDGWSAYPTTRDDVKLPITPIPGDCTPSISVDGVPLSGPPYLVLLGDLVVSTPVTNPSGTYYSDTITKSISWSGCVGLYFQAFEDCDHDHHFTACDGCEEDLDNFCLRCHPMCANGAVVPVHEATWGAIKALFE